MATNKFLLLIPLLQLLFNHLPAQDTLVIRGKVIDGETNDPIIGAYITLMNPSTITQGDIEGNFELVSIGNFRNLKSTIVKVHYTGYPDVDTCINLTNYFTGLTRKVVELKIALKTHHDDMPVILPMSIPKIEDKRKTDVKSKKIKSNN